MSTTTLGLRLLLIAAAVIVAAVARGAEPGTTAGCRAIVDSAERLRCFERALPAGEPQRAVALAGGWRLVRTPSPRGEADAVSIMHTADTARSDPDLAGLMLRCGSGGAEAVVVLLRPVSPRTRPQVSVTADGRAARFDATVVPPFTTVRLRADAAELVSGPWQGAAELAVEIDDEQAPIRGVVPVAGLRPAFQALLASCSP
ncbi:MAG: hypothetical protein ABSG76_11445 [Xanthobacteraceae bacterium]|jgi:hypothetical protein